MNPDDPRILANLKRLKAAGADDATLEAYLNEEAAKAQPTPAQRQLHARDVGRRMTSANEADAAAVPSYGTQALGGISALARDIPGVEAVQAGARSLIQGQPYRQALDDIRGAQADNPASGVTAFAGSIPAIAAIPGSPALQGARYGITKGLLSADPSTVEDRLHSAAIQGTVGAVLGKGAEVVGSGLRALGNMKSLGANALERKAAMAESDLFNYGRASAEGMGKTHPDVTQAFSAPDIQPYVDLVRKSRAFQGADDATVLSEVYKQMSKEQGGIMRRIKETGYDAASGLKAENIKLAKQQLLDAADQIMPSFRRAVAEHAAKAANTDVFKSAADAVRRVMLKTTVAGKSLETKSPEAFMASIEKMNPVEAKAATEGLLARLDERQALSGKLLKGFGIPKALVSTSRAAPYLRALDQRAGRLVPGLLQQAGTVGGTNALAGLLTP